MNEYMCFNLNITMGNAEMQTPEAVAANLELIAARIRSGSEDGAIRDVNGNEVGTYGFTRDVS